MAQEEIVVNIQKLDLEHVEAVRRIAESSAPPTLEDTQTLARAVLVLDQSVRDLIHAMAVGMSAKVLGGPV